MKDRRMKFLLTGTLGVSQGYCMHSQVLYAFTGTVGTLYRVSKYTSAMSIVSQLDKSLKFKPIRGDKLTVHCTI